MKKPTVKEREKALRLYWLILSVGWEEATRIMAEREKEKR